LVNGEISVPLDASDRNTTIQVAVYANDQLRPSDGQLVANTLDVRVVGDSHESARMDPIIVMASNAAGRTDFDDDSVVSRDYQSVDPNGVIEQAVDGKTFSLDYQAAPLR
jgi:hypothetical protein